jgi:hypothetical protein
MGSPKESLVKKNIFTEKYDEIRRLDGTEYAVKIIACILNVC